MDLELRLQGPDACEDVFADLNEWLSNTKGLKTALKPEERAPEHMGDLATILEVVLGSAAAVQLAQAVHAWIKDRKPRLTLHIKQKEPKGKGPTSREVTLDAQNLDDLKTVMRAVEDLVRKAGSE